MFHVVISIPIKKTLPNRKIMVYLQRSAARFFKKVKSAFPQNSS